MTKANPKLKNLRQPKIYKFHSAIHAEVPYNRILCSLNCATLGLVLKCSPASTKMVFALQTAIWLGDLDFGK